MIADTITDEAVLTDLVGRLPLDQEARWAEEVLRRISSTGAGCVRQGDDEGRKRASQMAAEALDKAGYNVETAAVKMQELYLGLARAD